MDPRVAAAADAKVREALDRVESAQRMLSLACQDLSPIIGGATAWRRVGKLADAVHDRRHWLYEWAQDHRGKLDLDEPARSRALEEASHAR